MKALGIISFENNNCYVSGITDTRPINSVSFLGRYRIIDFMISNFTNSGISNIDVFIKSKPRSVIQHINRTNYNINSKKGNILILYGEQEITNKIYNTDIASYNANMQFIEEANVPYVVIGPSHFIYTIDYNKVLETHRANNNDITLIYHNSENAKEEFIGCDTIEFGKNQRVKNIVDNHGKYKNRAISLESYIMSKSLFIDLCKKANEVSSIFWFKDIIKDSLDELNVYGYQHKGFCACINSINAYYNASMELRNYENAKTLFNKKWPIHTMTNDSCPTLYKNEGSAVGSIIGNGCIIEGQVINSIIGRNVVVKKGAIVKNSIILPSALINKNCYLENVIVDRYAVVTHVKQLKGSKENPIYVKRGDRI